MAVSVRKMTREDLLACADILCAVYNYEKRHPQIELRMPFCFVKWS